MVEFWHRHEVGEGEPERAAGRLRSGSTDDHDRAWSVVQDRVAHEPSGVSAPPERQVRPCLDGHHREPANVAPDDRDVAADAGPCANARPQAAPRHGPERSSGRSDVTGSAARALRARHPRGAGRGRPRGMRPVRDRVPPSPRPRRHRLRSLSPPAGARPVVGIAAIRANPLSAAEREQVARARAGDETGWIDITRTAPAPGCSHLFDGRVHRPLAPDRRRVLRRSRRRPPAPYRRPSGRATRRPPWLRSEDAYDPATDQWITSCGDGTGLIVYAIAPQPRVLILRLV